MKFGNYIHELLLEHETVIIPGFGAFISNYKPAELDSDSDNILPPSKEILFTQKIRNNDGLLVGYIAESEGISHFDALKKIEKDRENIIYQLDKGEKVKLENTGILYFDDKNEIQFESFQDDNLLLDSFGLEATSLKVTIEEDLKEEENDKSKTIIAGLPIVEPEPEEPEPVAVPEPEPIEEKRRSWLWYFLILIPIIIAGIFVISKEINAPKQGSEIQEDSLSNIITEPNTKNISPIDSLQNDSIQNMIIDSTQTVETELDSIEIKKQDSPKYYLIGGSFKAEENAEKHFQQLKNDGYEPFHLGKRGNFYIVGIGTYNTEKEASEAKRNFNIRNPGSGVWIKKE